MVKELISMSEAQETQQPSQEPKAPLGLRIIAKIITYIFHPLFMPVALAFVIISLSPNYFGALPQKQLNYWLLSIGITTLFFPLFSVALMKPLGFLSSLQMPTAKDRIIPLMTSMIFYFWVNHVFGNMPGVTVPLILRVLLLGNFWGIILVFMFNIFTKVSMHTAGAGIMVGILGVLMISSPINMVAPFLLSLLIAGAIGTARLILRAHEPYQIWLGYIIGILVQFAAYWYLK
jgi:hypothetical protein